MEKKTLIKKIGDALKNDKEFRIKNEIFDIDVFREEYDKKIIVCQVWYPINAHGRTYCNSIEEAADHLESLFDAFPRKDV